MDRASHGAESRVGRFAETLMVSPFLIASAAGTGTLTGILLEFARGGAEWVLWLLVLLSFLSFIVFFERLAFFRRNRTETQRIRAVLIQKLGTGDIDGALQSVKDDPSMQAHVVAYGLREAERGPDAVGELCRGALGMEKLRYERGFSILATIGSNAPFIGLFGTVMGVIMAFDALRELDPAAGSGQSSAVMGAIAEALVATGVGLLVAIPAILFFNTLRGMLKRQVASTGLLVDTMLAYLRAPAKGE
jgi:biopolymer transport protein ExbB/TolQ